MFSPAIHKVAFEERLIIHLYELAKSLDRVNHRSKFCIHYLETLHPSESGVRIKRKLRHENPLLHIDTSHSQKSRSDHASCNAFHICFPVFSFTVNSALFLIGLKY